jgi:hypothetical protein
MSSEANSSVLPESDLDLVRRAQQGDCDAFASLFQAHKARVYSVCLRLTNNTASHGGDCRVAALSSVVV